MAEKKIIDGKTLNAKLSNIGLSPNKKFAPSFEKLISLVIALSKKPKKGLPMGVFSIKNAKMNCNPKPQLTVLQLIFDLLFDKRKADDNKTKIPTKPVNLSSILTIYI